MIWKYIYYNEMEQQATILSWTVIYELQQMMLQIKHHMDTTINGEIISDLVGETQRLIVHHTELRKSG